MIHTGVSFLAAVKTAHSVLDNVFCESLEALTSEKT